MTGVINKNGILACNHTDGGNISLLGGASGFGNGGALILYDKAYADNGGNFLLQAGDGTNVKSLRGKPDGTLTWGNKNIVRSVVSSSGTADANGNISQGTLFTG